MRLTSAGGVTKKLRSALLRHTRMVTQMARLVRANSDAPASDTPRPMAFRIDRYRKRYHHPSGMPGFDPTRYPTHQIYTLYYVHLIELKFFSCE